MLFKIYRFHCVRFECCDSKFVNQPRISFERQAQVNRRLCGFWDNEIPISQINAPLQSKWSFFFAFLVDWKGLHYATELPFKAFSVPYRNWVKLVIYCCCVHFVLPSSHAITFEIGKMVAQKKNKKVELS